MIQVAKEKQLTINYVSSGEDIEIYGDSNRLEQVLTNLVSNAIKFTPENGEVAISCKQISTKELLDVDFYEQTLNEEYENYVKISVKDTGIGIRKEDIPKIFDKFQQIENTLSREVGGTGLGLPIAKQLTQAHKGLIWLESEINKGSCFNIAFPVMNDFQIFKMNTNQTLCNAKQFKKTVGLIMLTEKNSSNIIEKIKEEKLVVPNTSIQFNDVLLNDTNTQKYICSIQDADENSLDFAIKKIQGFVKSQVTDEKQNDIMYSKAIYPKFGLTTEVLLDKLNKNLECIKE